MVMSSSLKLESIQFGRERQVMYLFIISLIGDGSKAKVFIQYWERGNDVRKVFHSACFPVSTESLRILLTHKHP